MPYSKSIQASWDKQDEILDAMYNLFPVGVEQHDIGYKSVAETLGVRPHLVMRLKTILDELGVLKTRTTWKQETTPNEKGKEGHWTLVVDKDEAYRRIRRWRENFKAQRPRPRTPRPVSTPTAGNGASATSQPSEQLVASVGPDPDSPFAVLLSHARKDESYALVEAARQYAGRKKALLTKISELRDAGVQMKEGLTVEDVFSFDRDERLESVGLVLPYVEQLERTVENLATHSDRQRNELREIRQEYSGLRRLMNRERQPVQPTVVHAER